MTIRKIISYGTPGAESAARDVATRLKIPYEDGLRGSTKTQPERRVDHPSPPDGIHPIKEIRRRANHMPSRGTLIFTFGPLSDDLDDIQTDSLRSSYPCLGIDFEKIPPLNAAFQIDRWARRRSIQALVVTGTPLRDDQRIYQATYNALHGFLTLDSEVNPLQAANGMSTPAQPWPETVADAVQRLVEELPLKDKATIANMAASELPALNRRLGNYIRETFGIDAGNHALRRSCAWEAGKASLTEEEALALIIASLALKLEQTYKLRVL